MGIVTSSSYTKGAEDLHTHYTNFYLNAIVNFFAYAGVALWEILATDWYTIMYVLGFPVFFIMFFAENWDLNMVKDFSQNIYKTGLDSLQYMYISNTMQ